MTDKIMPCGHPQSCVRGRTTQHCGWCAAQADADHYRAECERLRILINAGHHACKDCNVQNPMIFMVTDEAWARVAQPDEWLCWGCYERRFEGTYWPLPHAADLTDAPCNADFGLLMECFEEAQADAHDAHERAEAAEALLRALPPTSAWQASAEAACQTLFGAVPSFQNLDVAHMHMEVEYKAKDVVEELERLRAESQTLKAERDTLLANCAAMREEVIVARDDAARMTQSAKTHPEWVAYASRQARLNMVLGGSAGRDLLERLGALTKSLAKYE